MANDHFTETSSTGWFSRIGGSITGMLIGVFLLLVSVVLLWWNEGRSVATAKGLAEGAQVSVEAQAESIDATKEGKLVHVVGKTTIKEPAKDDLFGVTGPDLAKLRRNVEIYQWVEETHKTTRNKIGGGTETVTEYNYSKKWDDKVQESSEFKHPEGHLNPEPTMKTAEFNAAEVDLAVYRLPDFLIAQWDDFKALPLPALDALPANFKEQATVQDKWLVLSKTPQAPVVGDVRVQFEAIKTGDASVLARQVKDTFEEYTTSQNTTIGRITSGVQSKDAMFSAAQAENTFIAWMLRVGGAFAMFFGFLTLFRPLKVLGDVLPLAGRIVGAGTGLIAFLLSAVGTTSIIAVAWLWYRPMLGIALLVVAVGGLILIKKAFRPKTA